MVCACAPCICLQVLVSVCIKPNAPACLFPAQADRRLRLFDTIMAKVTTAAGDAIASLPQPGADVPADPSAALLRQQLVAARDALLAAEAAAKLGMAEGCTPRQQAQCLKPLVQPAAQLAAALLQYWQLPEQVAAAQVELARAAATRACSNLRCANLGGEGGWAAGEGEGSRKCSGCRLAWYCGADCQNADWRGGGVHRKRECAALAQERQQQQRA